MNLEKIEELKKQSEELWNKYIETRNEIRRLEVEECNYEGKYIFIKEYGYMFVTWQHYDTNSIYGDERMFFQGFAFKSFITDYRDDFWFDSDACEEWNIPIDTFQHYIKDNAIVELTKEEFVSAYEEKLDKWKTEWPLMLKHCEITFKEKENEV